MEKKKKKVSETCGITNYGRDWRQDAVNQCLLLGAQFLAWGLFLELGQAHYKWKFDYLLCLCDDVELNVFGCRVDILGTSFDQCMCMVQCCFTSTETVRLIRTGSPGRPPQLSHSSWTLMCDDVFVTFFLIVFSARTAYLTASWCFLLPPSCCGFFVERSKGLN